MGVDLPSATFLVPESCNAGCHSKGQTLERGDQINEWMSYVPYINFGLCGARTPTVQCLSFDEGIPRMNELERMPR